MLDGVTFSQSETTDKVLLANTVGSRLRNADLNDKARKKLEYVAWWLVKDVNREVRSALAFELRRAPGLPKSLAVRIIQDMDEDVAAPFIASTDLFTDAEWVTLLDKLDDAGLTAVAHRSRISAPLARAVIEKGGERPVSFIVRNPGTRLSPNLCARVVARFGHSRQVMDGLASRRDLPMSVVQKLVFRVSDTARKRLVETYQVDSHLAGKVTQNAAESALLKHVRAQGDDLLADNLRRLALAGRLTDSFILTAAREGAVFVCVLALAQRSGLSVAEVKRRLAAADEDRFDEILCRAEMGRDARKALKPYLVAAARR